MSGWVFWVGAYHRKDGGTNAVSDGNEIAPKGQVFVCGCCGKQSKDRYGDQKISSGWDESCMMHAILCYERGPLDTMWLAVILPTGTDSGQMCIESESQHRS